MPPGDTILNAAFSNPSIKYIHWWASSDGWIWLECGGLLHSALQPKPVEAGLKKQTFTAHMVKMKIISGHLNYKK